MHAAAVVALVPLNQETRNAIDVDRVVLDPLPFRIGRESRFRMVGGQLVSMERRNQTGAPNNELYIRDQEQFLNVSREHLVIERAADGSLEVIDRGSTCGALVDETVIGTEAGRMRCALRHGTVIRIGTPASPFQFRVEIGGA
jgi:hypothetical protein